jgi:uncharacterized protein (TIGR03435 family)
VARWLLSSSVVVGVISASALAGQSSPAFDVASVRPNPNTNARPVQFIPASGPILITNHSLTALIRYAYGLTGRFDLLGGPQALLNEQFDIRAVPPAGATEKDVPLMMQTLLAERFNLRLRRETRDQPVYALVVDRADGRLGPQLSPSPYDCKTFFAAGNTVASPGAPVDEHGRRVCGTLMTLAAPGQPFTYRVRGVPIADFARSLEAWNFGSVDRPLVDRTGLQGNYDIEVEFVPASPLPNAPVPEAPILPVAMKEQLGLRLESRTEPRTVFIVESVERPTPD